MKASLVLACFALAPTLSAALAIKEDAAAAPKYVSEGFKLACPKEEYQRYRTILCSKALSECETDWCREHEQGWKKKFGACTQYGCDANPYEDDGKF